MSCSRRPPNVEGMTSLKVDNLNCHTSPDTLRRVFEKYGRIGDVYMPLEHFTREPRGFAFVRFYRKLHAEEAKYALDGIVLDGHRLHVQMARYGPLAVPKRSRHWKLLLCRYKRAYEGQSCSPRQHPPSLSNTRSRSRSQSRSQLGISKSPACSCSDGRSPTTYKSRSTRLSNSKSFVSRYHLLTRSCLKAKSLLPEYKRESTSRMRSKSVSKDPEGKGGDDPH